jgi:hydrogenase nickel incorporation protein HypB
MNLIRNFIIEGKLEEAKDLCKQTDTSISRMIEKGISRIGKPLSDIQTAIENVGNLVCPAEFDLGEAHKVAILSVTEGEDKPLKYPDMFRAADIMIINKVDLLPYLRFDIDKCEENARKVNPNIRIFRTSATTKEGLDQWIKWLTMQLAWCRMQ